MKPFRKILVPVDFSDQSQQAVKVAADFAKRNDGTVDIVHVYDLSVYPVPEGYVMFTPQQLARAFADFEQGLGALKDLALAEGAPRVHTHLRQGTPAPNICGLAGKDDFDLIVMGTHGRSGFSHLLLGSIAERVLRTAPCPVFTVRTPAAREQAATASA